MTMDRERLAELEKIAREATDGPWSLHHVDTEGGWIGGVTDEGDVGDVVCSHPDAPISMLHWPANAAHIAAFDPPTALALLSDLTEMREENERLEQREGMATVLLKFYAACGTDYLRDSVDNDGKPYQSAALELVLAKGRLWLDEGQALGTSHAS